MEWSGMEMEWSGMEMEWNGTEWKCNGIPFFGMYCSCRICHLVTTHYIWDVKVQLRQLGTCLSKYDRANRQTLASLHLHR